MKFEIGIIVNSGAAFTSWGSYLPFRSERPIDGPDDDVAEAIRHFRTILWDNSNSNTVRGRAAGWLSYCYMVVAIDGWTQRNWGDNEHSIGLRILSKRRAQLAKSFADQDWDVCWARSFERLHNGDPQIAMARIVKALDKAPPDVTELYAEAADILSYLGALALAKEKIESAIGQDAASGRTIKDWYRWIYGWVLYLLGVEAELAGDANGAQLYWAQARQSLDSMTTPLDDPAYEWDSLPLRALLTRLAPKAGDSATLWQDYAAEYKRRLCDVRRRLWTYDYEDNRSPFGEPDPQHPTGLPARLRIRWLHDVENVLNAVPDPASC